MRVMPAVRDMNKLNEFVRVAEYLSFTRAARELRTNPSVVSRHVSELEDMLGFSILHRSTHGVTLTEAGQKLLMHCRQMLATFDDYVIETRNIQSGPYGNLRVHAEAGLGRSLAPLIGVFLREHSQLSVQLVTELKSPSFLDDGCDVSIGTTRPAVPGLIETPLRILRKVTCAAPSYLKRSGRPRVPHELRNHNCILDWRQTAKTWRFRGASKSIVVEVHGSIASDNMDVLRQFALHGFGVIRVPHFVVKAELEAGALVALFDDQSETSSTLSVFHAKTRRVPAKISGFVRFLGAQMNEATARRNPLNAEIDEDKVAASFKKGFLSVTLPNTAQTQSKAKRIVGKS